MLLKLSIRLLRRFEKKLMKLKKEARKEERKSLVFAKIDIKDVRHSMFSFHRVSVSTQSLQ